MADLARLIVMVFSIITTWQSWLTVIEEPPCTALENFIEVAYTRLWSGSLKIISLVYAIRYVEASVRCRFAIRIP